MLALWWYLRYGLSYRSRPYSGRTTCLGLRPVTVLGGVRLPGPVEPCGHLAFFGAG